MRDYLNEPSKFDKAVLTIYEFSQARTQHEHLLGFRYSVSELSEGICPQCHKPMTTIETKSGAWGECIGAERWCWSFKRLITDERGIVQQALYPDFLVESFEVKNKLSIAGPGSIEIDGNEGYRISYNASESSELETVEVHCRVIDIHPPNKAMEICLGSDIGLRYTVKE